MNKKTHQFLYVIGAAEGTLARTLGELCDGKVSTLSCSPTAVEKVPTPLLGIKLEEIQYREVNP